MSTKITQSTVRVMISHNYSSFETTMSLENSDGIESTEIKDAMKQCQVLAAEAVADYKIQLKGVLVNPVKEISKIEKTVQDLKRAVRNNDEPIEEPEEVNQSEIERIASLPPYTPPVKSEEPKAKRTYNKKK